MSRERTSAGNILALSRSRDEEAKGVEEAATSYMPTDIDLDTLMPDAPPQSQENPAIRETSPLDARQSNRHERVAGDVRKGRATSARAAAKRKRVSLYLDDELLTKIFRVSLERHEQLSAATLRLILEALKARGL